MDAVKYPSTPLILTEQHTLSSPLTVSRELLFTSADTG